MFQQDIVKQILTTEYGTRSYSKTVFKAIEDSNKINEVASAVIDTIALGTINADPLLSVSQRVSVRIHRILGLDIPEDFSLLKMGTVALDWMAKADLIDVEKYLILDDKDKAKEQWFVRSISQDLTNYAQTISPSRTMVSPIEGVRCWTGPRCHIDDHIIPIVKKADRYDMLGLYTYEQMPTVYDCLNRLGAQGFAINAALRHLINTAPDKDSFKPPMVSEEDRKEALRSMNDTTRKARYVEEVKFVEMHKWLLKEAEVEDKLATKISKQKAAQASHDFYDTTIEPHLKVISNWSKRMDFDKIMRLANEWDNAVINYLFNLDTRGRIYTVQNYLTPLGSDVAKALLVFEGEYQVSGYDFCISIANCFGKDKLSFKDRVEWVNNNSDKLYAIGEDAWGNWDIILELELDGEDKTRWQALAHCLEYKRYVDYVNANGTEEGFTTSLVIGLDATASGTQILTILGRDNKVAPYVNVSNSGDRVGDFYTYLAGFMKIKLDAVHGISPTLDVLIDKFSEYGRPVAKRNSMTFSYSGTRFGFGQQHWEDRHKYNKTKKDTTGSDLTRKDCRKLGDLMHEVCEENIRGGAEIMQWLRKGIDYIQDGAVVRWTMPDGFIAFQVADESKDNRLSCTIGSRQVTLRYYTFQDKPKKSEHKNGIAPNWVHSYDSYLLRLIVNGMPEEAPISTVHDQFSTCSYYIEELQTTAKVAYKTIADRDVAESICEEAFGIHRPLPLVGTWDITEIDDAEFIIC